MDKEILHNGKFLKVVRVGHWEYVERTNGKDVAYIIPMAENKWGEAVAVFIKEYRIPLQNYVVGFPAGLVGDVDSHEDIITAAYRELLEETGYEAKRMRHLISGPSSAGLSNETIHYYLADRLIKTGEGGGDESEDIEIIEIPLHKAEGWLQEMSKQYLIDTKSYVGLYWANRVTLE